MNYCFTNRDLEALFTNRTNARRYPRQVVEAFVDVMSLIAAAADVRDLYASRWLHFEKLQGDRQGQYSLRLGHQFRLIVTLEEDAGSQYLAVHEIVDYH